jgi:hypothetical protein
LPSADWNTYEQAEPAGRSQGMGRILCGPSHWETAQLTRVCICATIVANVEIEFRHDGDQGRVTVTCVPNDDPAAVGKGKEARGFPVCSATVAYPGTGYRALFGWVQLVRSTDNASEGRAFEMDPLRFFEDSPAPYCWYGISPVLFDAPSRDERRPIEWLAHSFLAVTPREPDAPKRVVPLLGFSWGFVIGEDGRIVLRPVEQLAASDWNDHLPYLRDRYPSWQF